MSKHDTSHDRHGIRRTKRAQRPAEVRADLALAEGLAHPSATGEPACQGCGHPGRKWCWVCAEEEA